jgi:hypothetical protein
MANIREGLRYNAEIVGKLTLGRKLRLYGYSWNKVLMMEFCLTVSSS